MRVVSEPITKVTLNLYSSDVEWLKKKFRQGYTEMIREILRRSIREAKAKEEANLRYGPLDFSHRGENDYE